MRILVLTDRFVPEIAAPAFRIMEHAAVWQEMGHKVTVVTCAPNFPRGRVLEGYRNSVYHEDLVKGIQVLRLWSYMAANEGVFKRTIDNASFMCSAVLQCLRYPEFDVVLATSPPLFVPIAGRMISAIRKRPWVFELRDLWPASIEAVGALNGRILSILERIELGLYRNANRILSLTHSFKQNLIARGIVSDKIDVVENGVDDKIFSRENVTCDARRELNVDPGIFLVGYIGTVGMAHGLDSVVEAAALCKDGGSIVFLIMGEGAERNRLECLAQQKGVTNVVFKDFVPHSEVPNYLASLDCLVVHLKPHPVFRTVIPSKIFESMAMGTPLIHAVEGESADIVAAAGAGVCVPPGDPVALAEAILRLRKDRESLKDMGMRGRAAVRAKYNRKVKAHEALECLKRAAATKHTISPIR